MYSTTIDSAHTLNALYAGMDRLKLPRTVCIKSAFVKTDWEAGKLRCVNVDGHVQCAPAFVAAPIFDNKVFADAGRKEEIYAWAVTSGRHVDANYRRDGSLCGYLHGRMDLDYHIGDYRLAVTRVIQKNPSLGGVLQAGATAAVPLEARPLLLTADPLEVTHVDQAWLAIAVVLLCCCPCVGPVQVAALLAYACWARRGRYDHQPVSPEDYDDEGDDGRNGYGVPGAGRRGGFGA